MFVLSGSGTEDEEGSMHDNGDDSDCSIHKKSVTKVRTVPPPPKRAKIGPKIARAKTIKLPKNCGGKCTFTVDSVLLAFNSRTNRNMVVHFAQ